jgi:transposase
MTAQDVRTLPRSNEWQGLESRTNQMVFLCQFAETDTRSKLTTDDIAKTFSLRADDIRQIRHRAQMKKQTQHRPMTLHLEQEAELVRFVQERFGSQNYATERHILNFVEEQLNKTLTYGWMKRFLDRPESELRQVTVTL